VRGLKRLLLVVRRLERLLVMGRVERGLVVR
jgi:hypothetical protein